MRTTVIFLILFSMMLCAGIGVGISGLGALPVELTSFTTNLSGSNVELRWGTATEVNNYGFEVERSSAEARHAASLQWEKIGFVLGCGNSNSPKTYSFIDNKSLDGKLQYRLKQIDNNGAFKYTTTIEVGTGSLKYDLVQNYPNPFNPLTIITYSISTSSNVKVEVFNVLGKQIATLVNENQAKGNYKVNFDAAGLCSGIYYYKIQSGNFSTAKKMLLLK